MEIKKDNINVLNDIMNSFNLSTNEKIEFFNVIKEIFYHDEFQKRMNSMYKHHRDITLGYHILQTAVVTYLLCRKRRNKIDINIALKIAMMHDLYTFPWKNNGLAKTVSLKNNHGFRHPIESVINASFWYPDIFKNTNDAEKIIDGIVHHMYPYPTLKFINNNVNNLELKNYEFISNIKNLDLLEMSSNRGIIGSFSLSKSIYKEGRIVSMADTLVTIINFINNKEKKLTKKKQI